MKLDRIGLCPNDDLIIMLEWTISSWQFTAKIWSDTKCNKSLTQNHVVVELSSKVIRKWKWLLHFWNWPVFSAVSTEGLNDVILYLQPVDKKKNRGFCFLEYEDHKTAAQARRRLMSGKVKVWGNLVTVEWADPLEDPDPEVMAKVRVVPRTTVVCVCCSPDPLSADAEFCLAHHQVKVLFVRNLASSVTEELLEKAFSQFGKLERVKKLKDYAFIHFEERDGAVKVWPERTAGYSWSQWPVI